MSKKRGGGRKNGGNNKPNKPVSKNHDKPQTVNKNNLKLKPEPFRFTRTQSDILEDIQYPHGNLMILGYAGTAKTSTALYGALTELESGNYNKIIIIRSAVQSRDIGHLPGTVEEKAQVYEKPYQTLVNMFYGRGDAYGILRKTHIIDFELTSFLRGETFDNTLVIVDEIQNMTASELATVVTRIGINTKMILCGDILQRDLGRKNEQNVEKTLRILENMGSFTTYHMGIEDIVRSGIVKEFIIKQAEMYPDGL